LDTGLWALLALLGYWSPWLSLPPAALRLSGYDLAEWITFLPGVRDGSLLLNRLSFLTPLACLALLLGFAAARCPLRSGVRWGLWLLGLISAYNVLPVYPYLLTAYADPEFQLQFIVACAAGGGVLLCLALPPAWLDLPQLGLAVLGAWSGAAGLLAVRPAAMALMAGPWPVGIGWAAMLLGFAGLAGAGWRGLFGVRD
jgi:hypothetical protein